jgi:effector-associated domain 7 (EAD7)-containing protein/effector-associated domain 1 (EAD1)-containing protein
VGVLDDRPFRAADPRARALVAALRSAYYQADAVRVLVVSAGLDAAEFAWTRPMAQVWPDVLGRAADRGRLRRLVETVATDPGSAAYPVIADLLAEPAESESDGSESDGSEPAESESDGSESDGSESDGGADSTGAYRAAGVRRLLAEALSDDEFDALCFDHFRPVYDQFSRGMTRSQRSTQLMEYCARRGGLGPLVRLVSEINPAGYRELSGQLRDQGR